MGEREEPFQDHALGRPYHAALLDNKGRSQRHGHRDYFEVMAVADGTGEHHVYTPDGRAHAMPLRGGDVLLVRPRDRHAIVGGVQFYNVAFPATAWRLFVALAKVDVGWEHAELPFHTTVGNEQAVRACATVLEHFRHSPDELNLIRFWTDLIPLFTTEHAFGTRPTSEIPEWLAAATADMAQENNLRDGVPRLRALAHVSAAHLTRSMRRYHDMTPSEFVADLPRGAWRHAATIPAHHAARCHVIVHGALGNARSPSQPAGAASIPARNAWYRCAPARWSAQDGDKVDLDQQPIDRQNRMPAEDAVVGPGRIGAADA